MHDKLRLKNLSKTKPKNLYPDRKRKGYDNGKILQKQIKTYNEIDELGSATKYFFYIFSVSKTTL